MVFYSFSPLPLKRRRLSDIELMEAESAKAKLMDAKEKFGRELRVFETISLSSPSEEVTESGETDEFYEFTAEDYYRMLTTKKEDKFLKTRKLREAEEAARRSRITKAIIRIRFPDNHTLEAAFHPSETMQSLVELLTKVLSQPERPFFIYTTPPKKQIEDMTQDFYSAGFIPGAIVYFMYVQPKAEDGTTANSLQFLKDEIMSLKNLGTPTGKAEFLQSAMESEPVVPSLPPVPDQKSKDKKPIKPKWLKM